MVVKPCEYIDLILVLCKCLDSLLLFPPNQSSSALVSSSLVFHSSCLFFSIGLWR